MIKIKIQLLIFVLSGLTAVTRAQNKTIYYGTPDTGGAEIHMTEDNTYEIKLKTGTYEKIDNKYFIHNAPQLENSRFSLISKKGNAKNDSITISFPRRIFMEEDIYIGYKLPNTSKYKYLGLVIETRLFNTNPDDKTYTFKIPRSNYLQFAYHTRYSNKTYIETFKLSENTTHVYCEFMHQIGKDRNKQAFAKIDNGGELVVNKKCFSTENPSGDYVEKIASDSLKNWKVPYAVEKEAYRKFNDPRLIYRPKMSVSLTKRKEELPKISTLDEALALVKKDETKILLIFNQLLDNNAISEFDDFVRGVHWYATNTDYLPYLNNYIFYLTKPEDITRISKYNAEKVNEVIALNSDHITLFRESISMGAFDSKYGGTLNLNKDLSDRLLAINAFYSFEKKIKTNTITAKDFFKLVNIKNILDLIGRHNQAEYDEGIIETTEEIIETTEEISSADSETEKRESDASFYKPRYTPAHLRQVLEDLIEKHKDDQKINVPYAELALDYIGYNYTYKDLIGLNPYENSKLDYEFCLYLSKFADDVSQLNVKQYENKDHIIYRIAKELDTPYSDDYPDLVVKSYNNLMKLEAFSGWFAREYFVYILDNKLNGYEAFDLFMNRIAPGESNYLANIKAFEEKHLPGYKTIEGHDFIELVSEIANVFAWQIVEEHNTDKILVKKAIKWSEIAIQIDPVSHYYLDTYAQLLYFNGEIEKAKQTETEAIRIAGSDTESENIKLYKVTLEKMKAGTLKY